MNAALSTAHGARRAHTQGQQDRAEAGRRKIKRTKTAKHRAASSELLEALDNDDVEDLDFNETGESDLSDSDSDTDDSQLHHSLSSEKKPSDDGSQLFADDEQANEADDTEELVMDVIVRHAAVTKQVYMWYYNKVHAHRRRHYVGLGTSSQRHEVAYDTSVVSTRAPEPSPLQRKTAAVMGFWSNRSVLCLPILHPQYPVALAWAVLMMLVDAIYSAFLVPLSAAFCFNPHKSWCRAVEYVAGPIFALNILLGFHIGFVISFNLRRMTVTRPELVARFYITHGGFWLDALATVSFIMAIVGEVIDASVAFRVASRLLLLFRLIRVYRLLTVMFMASVSARSGGKEGMGFLSSFRLYAMTLLFTACFFINAFACFFYVLADMDGGVGRSWLSKYNSSFGPTSIPPMDILNGTEYRQWQLSVYYVTTTLVTVGYGDITPATTLEQIMAIIMMLTAACMFAVLISSISEALSSMTADARTGSTMRKKLATVMQWMSDRNVPQRERKRILRFYSGVWRQHQKEFQSELHIYEELPTCLRAKVAKATLQPLLAPSVMLPSRSIPGVMKPWPLQPAHIQLLAEKFVPLELMPGRDLFVEGADADAVYLLEYGRLEVFQHQRLLYTYDNTEEDQNAIWIGMSGVLSFYDITIVRRRPMCVRAVFGAKLWRIELESLKPMLRTQLEFRKMLLRMFQHQMLQALKSQTDTRAAMDPVSGVPTSSQGPGLHSFEWNEFHAFMRIPADTPDIAAKLGVYRQWVEELSKAKPSQLVGLLSSILEESPIGTEMHVTQMVLLTAGTTIRTKTLQSTSSSLQARKSSAPPSSRSPQHSLTMVMGSTHTIDNDVFVSSDGSDDERDT